MRRQPFDLPTPRLPVSRGGRDQIRRSRCGLRCTECSALILSMSQRDVNASPETARALFDQAGRKHVETCPSAKLEFFRAELRRRKVK